MAVFAYLESTNAYYGYGGYYNGIMGGFGGLSMIFIIPIGLVLLIVIAMRFGEVLVGEAIMMGTNGRDNVLDILQRRYARGENQQRTIRANEKRHNSLKK